MTAAAQPQPSEAADAAEAAVPREAWLDAAMALLIERGVGQVKIMTLSARLGVARSSFYWRFRDRRALLDELLAAWEAQNTGGFRAQCAAPAETVTGALCNLFRCFVDTRLFDHRLDFAIRDWARRDPAARARLDAADAARLDALRALFLRYGYAPEDATIRARVVYLMQLGYYAVDMREPLDARMANAPFYLETFTGRKPQPEELAALDAYTRGLAAG